MLLPLKKLFKSYTSFTRTERIGLLGLCLLLILFISVRVTMSLWVHPPNNDEENKKLSAAWETFKRSQPVETDDNTDKTKKDHQDAFDESTSPLPDTINVNTADSATLVRLKGIGPVTAGKIKARIKSKGPFTDIEQLKEVGVFTNETFELLKKHVIAR